MSACENAFGATAAASGSAFARHTHLPHCLLDSAERQQEPCAEVVISLRVVWVKLDCSAEAALRLHPLRITGVFHPKSAVRFSEKGVQLDRLLRRYWHLLEFAGVVTLKILRGTSDVSGCQTCVRWCEERVLRDYRMVDTGCFVCGRAVALIRQSACTQVKTVGFDARFISPTPPAELQAQVVHNSDRDFVLKGEHVRQLPVEPA
jgi:hypothetical protein